MTIPNLDSNFLKHISFERRDPEFAAQLLELKLAGEYARKMLNAGKLTKQENDDYQAHLYGKFIDALPADDFAEMMKDGRLDTLQALAGHDGKRDAGDVEDARKALDAKIKADALDDAWLSQRISAEHYANANREIGRSSEDMDDRLAQGDFDGAASESFASRHDDNLSPVQKDLQSYLKSTYGKGKDAPPGRVVREDVEASQTAELDGYLKTTYGSRDEDGSSRDKGSATSSDPGGRVEHEEVWRPSSSRIIDLDAPDASEAA